MCCRHGNPPVSIQPGLRLLEVGGVGHRKKNRRPQLSAGACWLSWGLGNGALSPRNLTLLGRGGTEMAGGGRPGSGVLPVNWAKWVSQGLKAREMWVQILHVHLLLGSPGDHHFILCVQHPQSWLRRSITPLSPGSAEEIRDQLEAGPSVLPHPLLSPP